MIRWRGLDQCQRLPYLTAASMADRMDEKDATLAVVKAVYLVERKVGLLARSAVVWVKQWVMLIATRNEPYDQRIR